eukprot:TRINITY_DN396_c0_g1_i1.p1 TRINITY_DN396_c0_g1~~TRINITY_DN396_c0_g1_i1.p1  ORF type:complete len:249 (+),score=32.46 TRINITY_DN396_c0_g1_i1:173-919(+)
MAQTHKPDSTSRPLPIQLLLSSAISGPPIPIKFQVPAILSPKASNELKAALFAVRAWLQHAERTLKGLSTNIPPFQWLSNVHKQFHITLQGFRNERIQVAPRAQCRFAAILPGDSVAALVVSNGISNFLNLYNTLLVVRLVLTWFPNAPPALVSPLSTLCDPYLNIFRGIIPPLGGTIDLSPILAFFVLNAVTSTAAALPAELPENTENRSSVMPISSYYGNLTRSQKLWLKRQKNSSRASEHGEQAN